MTKLIDNSENIKEISETNKKFIALCAATIDYYYGINDGNEVMLTLKDGGLAITVTDKEGKTLIKSNVECSKEEAYDCMFAILEDAFTDYCFTYRSIVDKPNSSRDTQTLSFVHEQFKLSINPTEGPTEKEEHTEQGIPTPQELVDKLLELQRSRAEAQSKVSEKGRPYTYIA